LDIERIAFTLASRVAPEFRLYEVLPALTALYTIAGNYASVCVHPVIIEREFLQRM
jgi:hypothetical protein